MGLKKSLSLPLHRDLADFLKRIRKKHGINAKQVSDLPTRSDFVVMKIRCENRTGGGSPGALSAPATVEISQADASCLA